MSWYADFKVYLDDLADRISLRKRFPGYFNVWIFRGAVLFMVVLLGFVAYNDGHGLEPMVYLECPVGVTGGRCANPYYGMDCYEILPLKYFDLCSKETFFPGETYGDRPSWLFQNFVFIGCLVVLFAFGINHLFYRWRSGQWFYSK